jgi:Xaa-Pro aminopeptidase
MTIEEEKTCLRVEDFYRQRRKKLAGMLPEQAAAVIYAGREVPKSLDENYPFYVNNNYFYFTGLTDPEGIFVMVRDGGTIRSHLFIRKPDPDKEKWFGRYLTAAEARRISAIDAVDYLETFDEWFLAEAEGKTFYMDDTLPAHQTLDIGGGSFTSLMPILSEMRLIKDDYEVAMLRRAIDVTDKGIHAILKQMQPGQYEYQMEGLFEYTVYDRGSEEVSFETIAASGENGPILHYMTNRNILKDHTMVLFDLGARYRGYCADISRTFPVNGRYTEDQKKLYNAVLQAQKEIIPYYQAGAEMKDVQQVSRELLWQYGGKTGLFAKDATIDDYYYHGIGHSLGLDTHDLCESRALTLEPGMVITCEPGLYIADRGMGIRIEDDILVTEDGPVVLSQQIIKEADAIEAAMA